MKKNLFYVMSLATVFSLGSCSQEDLADAQKEDEVKLEIATISADVTQSRTAVEGSSIPSGKSVGLFLMNQGLTANYNTESSNVKYTASGSGSSQSWYSTTAPALDDASGNAFIYYPYNEDATNIEAIPIDNTNEPVDFMYSSSSSTVSYSNPQATFTLKHLCAWFEILITKGTYTGNCNLTEIGMIDGTAFQGTFNLKTNTFNENNQGDYSWTVNDNFTSGATYNLFPIITDTPYDMSPSLQLKIDGNNTWIVILKDNNGNEVAPKAGYKYSVEVTINRKINAAAVKTISVTPWQNGGSDYYVEQPVTW